MFTFFVMYLDDFHDYWMDCDSEKSCQSSKIILIMVFFEMANRLIKDREQAPTDKHG